MIVIQSPKRQLVRGSSSDIGRKWSAMEPKIDHIQITVRDMKVAVPFYDKLLPLLGFDPKMRSAAVLEEREFHVVEWQHPKLCLPSPRHEPLLQKTQSIAEKLGLYTIWLLKLNLAQKLIDSTLN